MRTKYSSCEPQCIIINNTLEINCYFTYLGVTTLQKLIEYFELIQNGCGLREALPWISGLKFTLLWMSGLRVALPWMPGCMSPELLLRNHLWGTALTRRRRQGMCSQSSANVPLAEPVRDVLILGVMHKCHNSLSEQRLVLWMEKSISVPSHYTKNKILLWFDFLLQQDSSLSLALFPTHRGFQSNPAWL